MDEAIWARNKKKSQRPSYTSDQGPLLPEVSKASYTSALGLLHEVPKAQLYLLLGATPQSPTGPAIPSPQGYSPKSHIPSYTFSLGPLPEVPQAQLYLLPGDTPRSSNVTNLTLTCDHPLLLVEGIIDEKYPAHCNVSAVPA